MKLRVVSPGPSPVMAASDEPQRLSMAVQAETAALLSGAHCGRLLVSGLRRGVGAFFLPGHGDPAGPLYGWPGFAQFRVVIEDVYRLLSA